MKINQIEINQAILSNPQRKRKVAHHEAAHLVTYLAYSFDAMEWPYVEKVSIEAENGPLLGYVRRRPMIPLILAQEPGYIQSFDIFRQKVESEVKEALAGPASDFILSESYEGDPSAFFFGDFLWEDSADLEMAIEYGSLLDKRIIDEAAEGESLFSFFMEALGDVQKYWPLIQEVATRLLEGSPVIEGQELEALIESLYERILRQKPADAEGRKRD
jgi:hypothetical protein